jgi:hypothetical protein
MTRARDNADHSSFPGILEHDDGLFISNEDVFENDLTVAANTNVLVAGPVTIPNVTVTGHLAVTDELTIPAAGVLTISNNLRIF